MDLKGKPSSAIIGKYAIVPGQKDNALELQGSKFNKSYVTLADFNNTCLPKPSTCVYGFTISFWLKLGEVLNDGVLLQLSISRKHPGITMNVIVSRFPFVLEFHINTQTYMYKTTERLRFDDWHHIVLMWNPTKMRKMTLFLNCSTMNNLKTIVKKRTRNNKTGEDTKLVLGANHSGKRTLPIIIDNLAIWFKNLPDHRICDILKQDRG